MKQPFLYQPLFIFLLLAGLWSCTDEANAPGSDTEEPRTCLTINVTDNGYYASTGKPTTRTKQDDYQTTFTKDDRIGLYAIKDGALVEGYNNVCITYDGTQWTLPENTNLTYEGKGITYYAYYPYQDSPEINLSASDESEFFQTMISGWTPNNSQSDDAAYTSQDLMTGTGTLSERQSDGFRLLTVSLTHQMALVVIEFPHTRYQLDVDPKYAWFINVPEAAFTSFSPYREKDSNDKGTGSYRYLVKPGNSGGSTLSGCYTATNGVTKNWEFTPTAITAGKYRTYKVDGGKTTIEHPLQVGDFYLNDGSLIGKDKSLNNAQKTACLGIVYTLQDIRKDNCGLLDSKFPRGTHGLVVAKSAKRDGDESLWTGGDLTGSLNSIWPDKPKDYEGLTDTIKMQGYINTAFLQKYNPNERVFVYMSAYSQSNVAPASSSGWYCASIMELKIMCRGENEVNKPGAVAGRNLLATQFGKCGGEQFTTGAGRASWSSSQMGTGVWMMIFNTHTDGGSTYTAGDSYLRGKSQRWYHFRFVLAF